MWVRINAVRNTRADWLARLTEVAADTPIAELPAAVLLASPVSVDDLPGFAEGDCSVQDAASQFAAGVLDVRPGMRVLDACAAPGGKTTHVLETVNNSAQVTALDQSESRLQRVEENLRRLQMSANVVCGDALLPEQWWDGELYDRILVDAPCSATGVLRRHPDIRFLRRADDLSRLQQTQLSLLHALWKLLKPGGRLLYSTCSVLRSENEQVIEAFVQEQPTAAVLNMRDRFPDKLTAAAIHGVYLLPGRQQTDGFYYALMERTAV